MCKAVLLVDFENIFRAFGKPPFSATRAEALQETLHLLRRVRDSVRNDGSTLVVERAYADWDAVCRGAERQLWLAGITPVYCLGVVGKSSSDIALALEAAEIVDSTEPDEVVLVAGDRDYFPLLQKVKSHGLHVAIFALSSSLSKDLRQFVAEHPTMSIAKLDPWIGLRVAGATDSNASGAAPDTDAEPAPSTLRSVPAPAPGAKAKSDRRWRLEHERLLADLVVCANRGGRREIRLGPFFRRLNDEPVEGLKPNKVRRLLEDLKQADIITIEKREASEGFTYSVARLNWNDERVRAANT